MSKIYVVGKNEKKASPKTLLPGGTQVYQVKGSVYVKALSSAGKALAVNRDQKKSNLDKGSNRIRTKAG